MSKELGRLEDLPRDYLASLAALNLVPLWPSLRAVLPPGRPRPNTKPRCWSYQALRPLLMRAGESLAADQPALEAVQLMYVNPETGGDAQNILGYYALMLRPGQTLRLPARSPASVFHVIEGSASVKIDQHDFALAEADTCCAPGYTAITLTNRSADRPAFLFVADESPLHRKLGVYEVFE
jgi:gentisate 1,2-dioxygenase